MVYGLFHDRQKNLTVRNGTKNSLLPTSISVCLYVVEIIFIRTQKAGFLADFVLQAGDIERRVDVR